MKKYKVEGRIRADVTFEEIVEASSEEAAMNKAEKIVCKRIGIEVNEIMDNEYYLEIIK